MGRSNVNTVQVGADTKINLRSQSWGRKRVPLGQMCAFTPKLNAGTVGEMDNRFPVATYGTYEGCEVSFEHHLADNGDINSMLMDTNPVGNILPMIEELAVANQVSCWVNYYSPSLGYQYGWEYASMLRLKGNPNNNSLKDPTKISKSFEGAMMMGAVGKTGQKCALQYVRFVVSTVQNPSGDDISMSVGGSGTFPNAPVAIPLPAGVNLGSSQNYVDAYKSNPASGLLPTQLNGNTANGAAVDFTITGSTFAPTVAAAAGDVFEVWVSVQPTTPVL